MVGAVAQDAQQHVWVHGGGDAARGGPTPRDVGLRLQVWRGQGRGGLMKLDPVQAAGACRAGRSVSSSGWMLSGGGVAAMPQRTVHCSALPRWHLHTSGATWAAASAAAAYNPYLLEVLYHQPSVQLHSVHHIAQRAAQRVHLPDGQLTEQCKARAGQAGIYR